MSWLRADQYKGVQAIPTAAYDLLLKLKKLCNRVNSCCDVGAVEMRWMGMGNALGFLPVEFKALKTLDWALDQVKEGRGLFVAQRGEHSVEEAVGVCI
ncbi:hypothetical protein TURU_158101 [Turdus rufiventris]|nr:hypothetical protein TURU_158101 [Turdus rufiventris]